MRAVWCVLVVLCLLSPLGTVGITSAPADADIELAAPRSVSLAPIEERAPDVAMTVPTPPVMTSLVRGQAVSIPEARSVLRARVVEPAIRSRASPG
jgi:hypothetical protein